MLGRAKSNGSGIKKVGVAVPGRGIARTAFADGGQLPVADDPEEDTQPSGLLHSAVAGRTDHLMVEAPAGGYVIPADVVSGLGEGNTLAGAKLIQLALQSGPYGTQVKKMRPHQTIPKPPGVDQQTEETETAPPDLMPQEPRARGGKMLGRGKTTPILGAGGEFMLSPADVRRIGQGDLKRGHDVLDHWVVQKRKEIAKEMLALPGPVKD